MVQEEYPTSIIVGAGEIGKGLYEVLKETYGESVFIRDIDPVKNLPKKVDFLHICFPYSQQFLQYVNKYVGFYDPTFVVIHSTVPVGTTEQITGIQVVHSPIRGKHPYLADSIRTFVKFVGGPSESANRVAEYLVNAKINTVTVKDAKTTELMKIVSTTLYGWQIVACKEVERLCKEYDVNFDDVYTFPNSTYNKGYEEIGMGQFRKPYLKAMPGPIGGHCVVQNCDLLDDPFTQTVKDYNDIYEIEV